MSTIKFSEIQNLKKLRTRRRLNAAIPEFIASLLGEYALSGLGYDDSDTDIYSPFSTFFSSTELSPQELLKKERILQVEELSALYREFPEVNSDGSFDDTVWNHFMSESEWEETSEGHRFTLNGHEYRMPRKLLTLRQGGDGYFAQRYSQKGTEAEYLDIGTASNQRATGFSCLFAQASVLPFDREEQESNVFVSEEEFFHIDPVVMAADAEQREAIKSSPEKNLVVLAGAGSGKTRTLVCRLAYLHLVKRIPLNRILLLTFTTSAAYSMKRQSSNLMGPIYAKRCPLDKPNVNARTIDSFAIGLLDTYYLQMGFEQKPVKCLDGNADSNREKLKMLEEAIIENNMQGVFGYYFDPKTGLAGKNFHWLMKNLLDYACGIPINCAGFDTLLTLYMNKQRERGKVMGFTEASLFVKEAMCQPDSALASVISNCYSCILIDEFQDINGLQNSIFEPLYNSRIHFTLVGDDDQSIYYWRGSNTSIIKKFLSAPNTAVTYLLTNYRNNPNIVRAGNAVLKTINNRAKQNKPIRPNRISGEKIYISTYDEKYTNLVNEVTRLLKTQPPEEICILSRTKEDRETIVRSLGAADISVATEQIRIDVDDDYKLMRAVLNILNHSNMIASAKEIQRISGVTDVTERHIQKIVLGECSETECEDELHPVKELSDELRLSPISDLAEAVYRYSIKAAELFLNIINDRHSAPVFQAFEDFCRNNSAVWPTPRHQLQELFKTFEDDTRKENGPNGPLSNGVKVSTIHAAKGLEYNVVMITGLSAGKYPSTEQIDKTYAARKSQIRTLGESRNHYYQMQQTVSPELITQVLDSCVNPAFSQIEKDKLAEFQGDMAEIRNKLSALTADGVEEYLDAYRYYVQPLERQCAENISEQDRLLLIERTKAETLRDEITLLEMEDRWAASARREELGKTREKVLGIERRIEKLKGRELRFQKSITPLKNFYNICFNTSGFLADMAKESEATELYAQSDAEREQRINEERRLYYVAITRAKDYLYLCHAVGTEPSEFIQIIDEDLRADHVMLTLEEEQECQRLALALHKETSKVKKVDDKKAVEYTEELMAVDKFQAHIRENLQTFNTLHPIFQTLSTEAKAYYDRAVGLIAIAELTGDDFKTEFAHNMQRMSEVVLLQYAGTAAQPFKTTDPKLTTEIVNNIRDIAKNCVTGKPNPKYLTSLLMGPERFSASNWGLKNWGILHYLIRSDKYPVGPKLLSTWSNSEPLKNADKFLVAVLDLANMRNALIHPGKSDWTEDVVPQILANAELLVSECRIEPRKLSAKDVRIGQRVKHEDFGYGTIRAVEGISFRVAFDGSNEKNFPIPVSESYVFLAL